MMLLLDIGPCPCDEDCAQVGDPDYDRKAHRECLHYIDAIRIKLGREPIGAKLVVVRHRHDFGLYHEVACRYDNNVEAAIEYAFKAESDAPSTWAEVGFAKP